MSVKCGNHGGARVWHENADEVRRCYASGRFTPCPNPAHSECEQDTIHCVSDETLAEVSAEVEETQTVTLPNLADEPVEGIYSLAGTLYKVVQAQTGNWYAKEFDAATSEWGYAGRRPLHALTADNKISAEDAAKFGHLTGTCVFCARRLTDERSIFVGYGPTCAERHGLVWGPTRPVPSVSVEEIVEQMKPDPWRIPNDQYGWSL